LNNLADDHSKPDAKALMQQEDYILREIQKISLLLQALLKKLIFSRGKTSMMEEGVFGEAKDQLLDEAGFDLEKFLNMNELESYQYLSGLQGYDTGNLEVLSGILEEFGMHAAPAGKALFLGKALQLLEFCNVNDRTFSFNREGKINGLRNSLKKVTP
jgi:hypothetical protein